MASIGSSKEDWYRRCEGILGNKFIRLGDESVMGLCEMTACEDSHIVNVGSRRACTNRLRR